MLFRSYGNANPEPFFLFRNLEVKKQWPSGVGHRHLRATVATDETARELTWFGAAAMAGRLPERIDVVGLPEVVGGRLRIRVASIRSA